MTISELDGIRVVKEVRRAELAAFLKSRRARVTPESVGLPAGSRRRTPGLRREEVAQLSGIGITWYTWMEQGRPINVSVQVLDAVARTLSLDETEKAHLYRMAGVPSVPSASVDGTLPEELQTILDHLGVLPASVVSAKYDLLACNEAYERLFPRCTKTASDGRPRNLLWEIFTLADCCNPFVTRADEVGRMVAYLRSAYGKYVDDPEWRAYIERMCGASTDFARMWERNDVAAPPLRVRTVRHPAVGDVEVKMTGMTLPAPAGAWVQIVTPSTDHAREQLERISTMSEEELMAPVRAHVEVHRQIARSAAG
ncbi:helix-turn-helix transcriptional regulator [Luteipulveratus mongoliensis]|uniref:XRE family transcriptional regulator n=1 Tax=Luteipulveratus mongoliensis TaxID=571913 RepID=A0A0K1JMM1_9MICO|nr:helix-turn-helix transcriptional regulator [Luteipulveratus mongoliensis]AKU17967.1 XRE family transcriptional regulator [Luteipulveratus mongoliensis]